MFRKVGSRRAIAGTQKIEVEPWGGVTKKTTGSTMCCHVAMAKCMGRDV